MPDPLSLFLAGIACQSTAFGIYLNALLVFAVVIGERPTG